MMFYDGVSFVFPMFNERANLENTILRTKLLAKEIAADYEIVVVDDASSDGSGELLDKIAATDQHVVSVRLKKNMKFGGALNAGLLTAKKPIIIYTDSDFPAKEQDIKNALELLKSSGTDIVTARSILTKDPNFKRVLMSKVYNFLVRSLFKLKLSDINSGLKIYKSHTIKPEGYLSRSPFIDVEIFVEAIKNGYRIEQYGLIFETRTGGVSTISRLSIVLRTFLDMFRYRFFR